MSSYGVAIIGLGAVGRRFLSLMTAHPRFHVAGAWDPDADACAGAQSAAPELRIGADAAAVMAAPETDLVYVACPPLHHRAHVLAALAAGKAVFCEKPLGIDVEESRALVASVDVSGLPAAVNFVYGSAPAGVELGNRLRAGALGNVTGVELRLHFAQWPRPWQASAAAWLSRRAQGGFVREVVSHFLFLSHRLIGPARIERAALRYPSRSGEMAETHILARLDCDGVPVGILGQAGGVGPDIVEFTVWGDEGSCRVRDWYRLDESHDTAWTEVALGAENPAEAAYLRQLDNLAALLDGEAHSMPSFAEALAVQEVIEALLQG
ncbi:MAG: Gfo/Idh/MocA family oxidoreductase [Alphaproteobacteria bacterium]|nr:Gfo/Idh/MocA family oxidoreductase [Alphaproteobacteria bacterium]